MKFNSKKAAMFGLDARIALAIFGALSVISGAALYSAIKEARMTALVTEITEHGKAWEQYYLDTGENLPRLSTNPSNDNHYYLRTQFLVNKPANVSNWQGPYLNYPVTDTDYLLHKTLGKMALVEATDATNWGNTTSIASGYCTSGKQCFLWLHFSGATKELRTSLEDRYNEPNTPTSGKIKWYYFNDANQYRVFFKLYAVPNPHS